jgi:hypothetical protein
MAFMANEQSSHFVAVFRVLSAPLRIARVLVGRPTVLRRRPPEWG